MELSLLDLWYDSGTFAKGIIVTLAIMSVYSLSVGAAKWFRLYQSKKQTKNFAPEFARFLQEDQLDAAIELAEQQKISHVARVLGEALNEVKPLLADRATVTTGDINAGSIDGAVIGAAVPAAITGITIDATTDFTVGATVITDGVITDATGLQIAAVVDMATNAINNAGAITIPPLHAMHVCTAARTAGRGYLSRKWYSYAAT